jgi:hypothetical protein
MMKKLALGCMGGFAAGVALLAAPQAAEAQYVGISTPWGYRQVYSVPPPPRYTGYYHGVPAAGTPYSPFPWAMEYEIRYYNGMACRTLYEPGVGRIPVACVR